MLFMDSPLSLQAFKKLDLTGYVFCIRQCRYTLGTLARGGKWNCQSIETQLRYAVIVYYMSTISSRNL